MSGRLVQRASLALLLLLSGGCQRSLFTDAPRTQFEAHQRARGRYVPLEEPDAFGKPQPALRARLSGR